jgi:hypothetical protein
LNPGKSADPINTGNITMNTTNISEEIKHNRPTVLTDQPLAGAPISLSVITKSTIPAKRDKLNTSGDLILKALTIYDDLAFAAKVNETLRRIGCRAGVNVQWTMQCWPANILNEAVFAEKALVEALDAHLIAFPTRYAQSLPIWLHDWLERWATRRRIPDVALGVIKGEDDDPTQPTCPELSALLQRYSLQLIVSERPAPKDAVKLLVLFASERERSLPMERASVAHSTARESCRGMGINE